MGIIEVFIWAFIAWHDVNAQNTYSAIACYGGLENYCNILKLKCSDHERIYLLDQKYGSKNGSCSTSENDCFMPGSGCCSQTEGDCLKDYTRNNAYDLHRVCSGKSNCETPAAGYANCDTKQEWSTYGKISFSCIRASDVVHFCDHAFVEKGSAHIIFDKQDLTFNNHSFCSCNVASSEDLIVTYVDVRLETFHTSKSTTNCSSARLTSSPQIQAHVGCTYTFDDYQNFVYKRAVNTTVRNLRLELNDLFKMDAYDSPVYVWVLVKARNNANVNVTCDRTTYPSPITTTTTTTTLTTTTTTKTTEFTETTSQADVISNETSTGSATATTSQTTTTITTTANNTTTKTETTSGSATESVNESSSIGTINAVSTPISSSTTSATINSPTQNETTGPSSQTSVSSSTENSKANDVGTQNTVVIVGAVAAAVVVLVIVIALVCIIRFKRRAKPPNSIPDIPMKDTYTDDYAVISSDINPSAHTKPLYDNGISKSDVALENCSENKHKPRVPLRPDEKKQTESISKMLHTENNYIEFIKASYPGDQYLLPNETQCKNSKPADELRSVNTIVNTKQQMDIHLDGKAGDLTDYINPLSDSIKPKPCTQDKNDDTTDTKVVDVFNAKHKPKATEEEQMDFSKTI